MPVTIRSLLTHWGTSLRLVVPDEGQDRPSIDEPLSWVHSSELPDPTPFLDEGHLLLTDGSQFLPGATEARHYEDYVARLSENGIIGLGFGIPLVHGRLPPELEAACRRHELPLFLITDYTPFLAIARFVADALERERSARIRWSLDAQRAVARAAMRPDGLTSILTELERQLQCSALLFDAVGARIRPPGESLDTAHDHAIRDAVRATLERGLRSSSRVVVDDSEYTIQTIGHANQLDGALVLGGLEWSDPAAADLVNSVIALAGLALTQNRALDKAHAHLRAGLFEQLLKGELDLAMRTATSVWEGLPAEPLTVLVAPVPHHRDFLLDALERAAEERRSRIFFTERGEHLVVLAEIAFAGDVVELFGRHPVPVGCSGKVGYGALAHGLAEAQRALRHATDTGQPSVAFPDFIDRGVLGLLRGARAGVVARGILRVLADHDAAKGTDLLTTVQVWMRNECAWDASARELGIHRHTLRSRIEQAGHLLGLQLDSLRGRLELWAAIQLVDED
ncbi:PucR family transcriptional regulator [Mycobacterium sp. SMC-4]|uniref:PucR family transcriptional regulator n=1 Tax=Mycobacterium sp. SMC-4 TaxID=2857059 RepID=UPI003D04F098